MSRDLRAEIDAMHARQDAVDEWTDRPEPRAVSCPRCNAPAGLPCTNLAEGPVWEARWNHEARVLAYLESISS